MINLLPPQYNKQLHSSRLNSRLKKWIGFIWLATAGLALILIMGWFYIDQQDKNITQAVSDTKAELAAQNLTKVQQDSKELTNNIKTIDKVLSSEVRFSDLIQDIGKVIPQGTVLDSLMLSQVSGGIDLSAGAKNYESAAQVAVNLSDPDNKLFSKVDIVSISCTNSASVYPCTAIYRALFNKSAQAHYQGVAQESQ